MTDYATTPEKGNGPESIEPRDARALTEKMTVVPLGGDIYSVTTESGNEYRVDAVEGRCTCPDHRYREVRCKHVRRVAFAIGQCTVPQWADGDAVDDKLGEHIDGQPTPSNVATDGGTTTVETTNEDTTTDDDDRPDDCDCGDWNKGTDLPCWPCYRDGFEEPASSDD